MGMESAPRPNATPEPDGSEGGEGKLSVPDDMKPDLGFDSGATEERRLEKERKAKEDALTEVAGDNFHQPPPPKLPEKPDRAGQKALEENMVLVDPENNVEVDFNAHIPQPKEEPDMVVQPDADADLLKRAAERKEKNLRRKKRRMEGANEQMLPTKMDEAATRAKMEARRSKVVWRREIPMPADLDEETAGGLGQEDSDEQQQAIDEVRAAADDPTASEVGEQPSKSSASDTFKNKRIEYAPGAKESGSEFLWGGGEVSLDDEGEVDPNAQTTIDASAEEEVAQERQQKQAAATERRRQEQSDRFQERARQREAFEEITDEVRVEQGLPKESRLKHLEDKRLEKVSREDLQAFVEWREGQNDAVEGGQGDRARQVARATLRAFKGEPFTDPDTGKQFKYSNMNTDQRRALGDLAANALGALSEKDEEHLVRYMGSLDDEVTAAATMEGHRFGPFTELGTRQHVLGFIKGSLPGARAEMREVRARGVKALRAASREPVGELAKVCDQLKMDVPQARAFLNELADEMELMNARQELNDRGNIFSTTKGPNVKRSPEVVELTADYEVKEHVVVRNDETGVVQVVEPQAFREKLVGVSKGNRPKYSQIGGAFTTAAEAKRYAANVNEDELSELKPFKVKESRKLTADEKLKKESRGPDGRFLFSYEGMNSEGETVRGLLDAKSNLEAQGMIKRNGHFVTKLEMISRKKGRKGKRKAAA